MINGKRIVAIIQARMGSNRFPGKVLEKIYCDLSVLEILYRRMEITMNEGVDDVVVATTTNPLDDAIAAHCAERHIEVFRGSEEDVAARVLAASEHHHADIIVDVTADCPLVDPEMVMILLKQIEAGCDYASNVVLRTWPDGFDVQIYTRDAYRKLLAECPINREHSGWNFIQQWGKWTGQMYNETAPKECTHPDWELTIDHPQDLALLRIVLLLMRQKMDLNWEWEFFYFTSREVMDVMHEHPALLTINQGLRRKMESNPAATNDNSAVEELERLVYDLYDEWCCEGQLDDDKEVWKNRLGATFSAVKKGLRRKAESNPAAVLEGNVGLEPGFVDGKLIEISIVSKLDDVVQFEPGAESVIAVENGQRVLKIFRKATHIQTIPCGVENK